MRGRIFGLIMGAALFLAACSNNGVDKGSVPTTGAGASGIASTSASPGSSSVPGGGPVTGGVDKKTVCAAYQKAEGEAEAKLTVVVPKAAEAIANPSQAPAVLAELKAILATFEAALRTEAARSADAQLKAAIEADVAALVKAQQDLQAAGNDVGKAFAAINTDQFTAAGEKVKALCS